MINIPQEDGTCACKDGWTGEGCARATPGISRNVDATVRTAIPSPPRRRGAWARRFLTRRRRFCTYPCTMPRREQMRCSRWTLNPETFTASSLTSRGWAWLVPTAQMARQSSPSRSPPMRATAARRRVFSDRNGMFRWDTSQGSRSLQRNAFRRMVLSLQGPQQGLSGPLTGVLTFAQHTRGSQLTPYKFKIVKYVGKDCTGSSWDDCVIGSPDSAKSELRVRWERHHDALASEDNLTRWFKFSPPVVVSRGKSGWQLICTKIEFPIDPTLMNTTVGGTCPACATAPRGSEVRDCDVCARLLWTAKTGSSLRARIVRTEPRTQRCSRSPRTPRPLHHGPGHWS